MSSTIRHIFRKVPSAVSLITTQNRAATVSSFTSISLDPPIISISLAENSQTATDILKTHVFNLHLLSVNQQSLSEKYSNYKTANEFSNSTLINGLLQFPDCVSVIQCKYLTHNRIGDHHVIFASVEKIEYQNEHLEALVYVNKTYTRAL